jgi:hypothetical protein
MQRKTCDITGVAEQAFLKAAFPLSIFVKYWFLIAHSIWCWCSIIYSLSILLGSVSCWSSPPGLESMRISPLRKVVKEHIWLSGNKSWWAMMLTVIILWPFCPWTVNSGVRLMPSPACVDKDFWVRALLFSDSIHWHIQALCDPFGTVIVLSFFCSIEEGVCVCVASTQHNQQRHSTHFPCIQISK